jgi:hypothetical protein
MKNIGFFVRHFTERGTEVSVYDYAEYNEKILNNKSYIICFTMDKQKEVKLCMERISYPKFKDRFEILEIDDIQELKYIIKYYNLDFFYTQTYGGSNDIYQFENKKIWGNCKTIKHCVFETCYPESDFYISISNHLNERFHTNLPVIPLIVRPLPETYDNLREELGIPKDAVVLGRYGGEGEFNINYVHEVIRDYLLLYDQQKYNIPNIYFLFMNTNIFYEHSHIIYLPKNIDFMYKSKFINTCDAMIHARKMGETFGLAVGEFSIKNKGIITSKSGDLEHIKILGDKAIIYDSKEKLINIFTNINKYIEEKKDRNAYQYYSPENIMNLFNELIFSK